MEISKVGSLVEPFLIMKFDIITIFPGIFEGFVKESLLARAQKRGILKIGVHNLRDWTTDRHQTVDGRPFGGGPGMVMKVEPIYKAVKTLSRKNRKAKARVVLFSPRGKSFTQKDAKRLAKYDQLIMICGRYEGVDERVAEYVADEAISAGDYVLSGGEVPAMALIEAVSRMIPGVIAKEKSAQKPDHPQYTRPETFITNKKKLRVPKILLSGDHKKIEEWRRKRS